MIENDLVVPQTTLPTQHDSEFVVPSILPTDDPITSINKAMLFLNSIVSSRYPSTNNQLRISSNPRTQATIQNGQVTIWNVQGRQSQGYPVNTEKNQATRTRIINIVGETNANQPKEIRCYNCRVDNCGKCKSLDIVLLDQQELNKSFSELRKSFAKLKEYCISLELSLQHNKEKVTWDNSWKLHDTSLINEIKNKSFEINNMKVQLQYKTLAINELKHRLAKMHGKSQVNQCESPDFDSRIQKIEDENVSLAF
uniref:Uncharacterized protein n=1 Tax=Tanacetum cinerariifolium TaxID=118510 RepID=A0A6L2NNI9_TANCI|nr:hypothetical protein [Tanacetum cinerariifolium]